MNVLRNLNFFLKKSGCSIVPNKSPVRIQWMPASGYSFNDDYKTLRPVGWFTVLFLGGYYFKKEKRIQALSHQTNANNLPLYTLNEVAKHTSKQSRIWVTYKDGVYDITDFVDDHPGGEIILTAAGSAVDPFWMIYGIHKQQEILELLETYRIGNISKEESTESVADMEDPYANEPSRSSLLIINSKKPFNAEPPLPLLVEKFITPSDTFYIRNHLPVPLIDLNSYELEISAPNSTDVRLTMDELKTKFPMVNVTSTIQCAGNRRNEMTKIKPVKGLNWDAGAIGNAVWTGVRLYDVLKHYGLDSVPNIQHVQFEGLDTDPTNVPYGASIPIEKALNPANDVLLAFEMNGQPLTPDHGYPVRVVVPGVVGARNVKWLGRIILSSEESSSHWQQNDYKGFNPSVDWDTVDFKSAPAIQELPVMSAICSPLNGQKIKVKGGKMLVKGYAWSGGGCQIVRIDVTTDGGKRWMTADVLEREAVKAGRCWSWVLWQAEIPVNKETKMVEVWAKAVDSNYNTQPETFENIWNLRGVLGNAYHRIKVHVEHC